MKQKEKSPKVVEGNRCTAIGILLKMNNINVDSLVQYILSGGLGENSSDMVDQLLSLVTSPKKDPTKYDAEVNIIQYFPYDKERNATESQ
jgi:hypothetical protein